MIKDFRYVFVNQVQIAEENVKSKYHNFWSCCLAIRVTVAHHSLLLPAYLVKVEEKTKLKSLFDKHWVWIKIFQVFIKTNESNALKNS